MEKILEYPQRAKDLVKERENNARLSLRDMPETVAIKAGSLIRRASMAFDQIINETIQARDDERLSDSYRQEKINSYSDKFVTELVAVERYADDLALEAEKLLDSVPVPEQDTGRLKEIRERLASTNDAELAKRYQADVFAGEYSEIVAALEDDPLPRDFVTDHTRYESKLNRVRAIAPEVVERYTGSITGAKVTKQFTNSLAGLASNQPHAGFASFIQR